MRTRTHAHTTRLSGRYTSTDRPIDRLEWTTDSDDSTAKIQSLFHFVTNLVFEL